MRDILRQKDVCLELIVCDDGSNDGSREFLTALSEALGDRGELEVSPVEKKAKLMTGPVEAAEQASADETPKARHPKYVEKAEKEEARKRLEKEVDDEASPPAIEILTVEEVASATTASNRLHVVCGSHGGQGAAMNLCLARASAGLIGQMESDDERPDNCFRLLRDALAAHPEWDGVCSWAELIGWDRGGGKGTNRERDGGMARYVAWQNGLQTPQEIALNRYVEIPALHQSALYKRDVIEALGGYRSDEMKPLWPVDMDFWLRWCAKGHLMGKATLMQLTPNLTQLTPT